MVTKVNIEKAALMRYLGRHGTGFLEERENRLASNFAPPRKHTDSLPCPPTIPQ